MRSASALLSILTLAAFVSMPPNAVAKGDTDHATHIVMDAPQAEVTAVAVISLPVVLSFDVVRVRANCEIVVCDAAASLPGGRSTRSTITTTMYGSRCHTSATGCRA